MADTKEVEFDRRSSKKTGFVSHMLETFSGRQGRKVAFGIWGFIAADSLISTGKIDQVIYWKMFLTCALLIGFGTILDSIVAKVGDAFAGGVASRLSSVTVKKTEEVTTSVAADTKQP